ncbi:unnamed protein product, partial [Ectocarpus sp. 8 AP-2014]
LSLCSAWSSFFSCVAMARPRSPSAGPTQDHARGQGSVQRLGKLLAELCTGPGLTGGTSPNHRPSVDLDQALDGCISVLHTCTPSYVVFMIVALCRPAHSRPQWPVPGHRMDAVPCRLFVWNVASAARFCECSRHLESVADQTLWEDSHGQLWLRIPFSSPLLRLFPCQQHSLTRCARCGHEYRAHVEHTLKRHKDGNYDK